MAVYSLLFKRCDTLRLFNQPFLTCLLILVLIRFNYRLARINFRIAAFTEWIVLERRGAHKQ
jgi:hypothetical protein